MFVMHFLYLLMNLDFKLCWQIKILDAWPQSCTGGGGGYVWIQACTGKVWRMHKRGLKPCTGEVWRMHWGRLVDAHKSFKGCVHVGGLKHVRGTIYAICIWLTHARTGKDWSMQGIDWFLIFYFADLHLWLAGQVNLTAHVIQALLIYVQGRRLDREG